MPLEVDMDLGYTFEHDMLRWVLKMDITRTTTFWAVHNILKMNLTQKTLLSVVHNILETHLTPESSPLDSPQSNFQQISPLDPVYSSDEPNPDLCDLNDLGDAGSEQYLPRFQ